MAKFKLYKNANEDKLIYTPKKKRKKNTKKKEIQKKYAKPLSKTKRARHAKLNIELYFDKEKFYEPIVTEEGKKYYTRRLMADAIGSNKNSILWYEHKGFIPPHTYISEEGCLLYSEYQVELLKYGFNQVKKRNMKWVDVRDYLYERWYAEVADEETPITIQRSGGQH